MTKARIETLIEAMKIAGYHYDNIESCSDHIRFYYDCGNVTYFHSWDEVEQWLNVVVFDDPDLSNRVECIIHPERFIGKDIKEIEKKQMKRREFEFILDFAANSVMSGDRSIDPAADQLESLWTAYCLHWNLEPDTASYDSDALKVWNTLMENENQSAYVTFEDFDVHMGQWLC